jgi:hypothetical protein
MTRTPFVVSDFAVTTLLASYLTSAQQPAPQSTPQQHPMTFFITSSGMGKGADLGGLAGADTHCQALATAEAAATRRGIQRTRAEAAAKTI